MQNRPARRVHDGRVPTFATVGEVHVTKCQRLRSEGESLVAKNSVDFITAWVVALMSMQRVVVHGGELVGARVVLVLAVCVVCAVLYCAGKRVCKGEGGGRGTQGAS